MTTQQITEDRFRRWKKHLAENNATPLALVGIGQGAFSGKIVLCIPEKHDGIGLDDAEIARILLSVGNQLAGGCN